MLYESGKIKNIKDKPVHDKNIKDHYVIYTTILKRSDQSLTLNEINYIQKEIGISIYEKNFNYNIFCLFRFGFIIYFKNKIN